jgi:hypothetical protein
MRSEKLVHRRAIVPVLGLVLGVAAATGAVGRSPATAGRTSDQAPAVFDATHLPPLLTVPNDEIELAYDVHCAPPGDQLAEAGCDVGGTVFVRAVGHQSFAELRLEQRSRDGIRQLAVDVPNALARSTRGFEYFAVLESAELGRRIVVPAGGAAAPHVSRPLEHGVEIDLGRNVFGTHRRDGVRVAAASWGDGPADLGLELGRNLPAIGASAFDVDARGNVVILDQAHRRVLRWRRGAKMPDRVPVSVIGTLADLALADDGSMFVLETTAPLAQNPSVRRFDDGGRELEAIETADRSPSQIRAGTHGPVVLGGASHQWMPVMVGGVPASPAEQLRRGRSGRWYAGGAEVVVFRHANEIRIAIVNGQNVTRSWRIQSTTPLAEVQLAQPYGERLVVVVRVYESGFRDEFTVLVLGRVGLVERFALDASDWAETAPFGRFRLEGRSLYRLGSGPSGAFVDRFDLEVR